MVRFRFGALCAMVALGATTAALSSNCASPTQIIVDIRAETALCSVLRTGIAVTTAEEVNSKPLQTYQDNCLSESKEQSQVGLVTLQPSGADDATVWIRVVAAVGSNPNPDACGRTDIDGKASWANCILARRELRFVPGRTQRYTIRLTNDCVGQFCGDDRECNAGQCVRPEQVQEDGGTALELDADTPPDARVDDAPSDAPLDVNEDACARFCVGPTGSVTCNALDCTVTCDAPGCANKVVCGANLNCTIKCPNTNSCNKTRCATTGTCEFDCVGNNGGAARCTDIQCRADACAVQCGGAASACDGVALDAGTNTVLCPVNESKPTCKDIQCFGGTCARSCADGGLGCTVGDTSSCAGNCAAFEDAGDGGG